MHSKDSDSRPVNTNGRSLKPGPIEGPPIIQDWMVDGKLRFACVVAVLERAPACVQSLIAALRQRQREVQDTARKLFGTPALLAAEQEILAKRRRLVGTPALQDDRTARRLVQGDNRATTMAAGAV